MPFDPVRLADRITGLPPQPAGRGGGPQRIHVQIEIVDRLAPPRPGGYRFGTLALTLLILALLVALGAVR